MQADKDMLTRNVYLRCISESPQLGESRIAVAQCVSLRRRLGLHSPHERLLHTYHGASRRRQGLPNMIDFSNFVAAMCFQVAQSAKSLASCKRPELDYIHAEYRYSKNRRFHLSSNYVKRHQGRWSMWQALPSDVRIQTKLAESSNTNTSRNCVTSYFK